MAGLVTSAFLDDARARLGDDVVLTDEDALATYGHDWTTSVAGRPGAVALPRSTEQVSALLQLASTHDVAVVPSGGQTGLAGGAVAPGGELVLSLTRMRRIGPVDRVGRTLPVQAGAITAEVHAAAEEAGLLWPIDLAAKGSSTIGGNLATNAGGVRVLRYGGTRHWVLGLTAVLPSGEVLETGGSLVKNNTGYDLVQLLVGSEGTLAVVCEAVLKLTALPGPSEVLLVAYPGIEAAASLSMLTTEARLSPTAFEIFTDACLRAVEGAGNGRSPFAERAPVYGLLEVERPDDDGALLSFLQTAQERGLIVDGTVAPSLEKAAQLWGLRENITASLAETYGRVHKDDVSVPVAAVPAFVAELEELLAEERYRGVDAYLFGHLGDGNLHVNLAKPDALSEEAFTSLTARFDQECGALLRAHRGSVSAEHGIGLLKRSILDFSRTPLEQELFRRLKAAFDPTGILNPGKLLTAPRQPSD